MKATSLFGGVQVFTIIISMVRVKFVAVLLGTVGVGIVGLLNSPLQLIISLTGLGIAFSAVRDISEAYAKDDKKLISKKIIVLLRWSWLTGMLGMIVTIILAPWLSKWTFGNSNYTWAFVFLSITLLFQAIAKGQSSVLQGTRSLQAMAKSTILGSLLGLITALPLFYYFKTKGIVPSLIASSIAGLIITWFFYRKVDVVKTDMSLKETLIEGKSMVKLGLLMSLTGLLSFFTSYLLSIFISRTGGTAQVGLYNSGWSIIGQYTGLIFAAMVTDYFPRLVAVNYDNEKSRLLINQQAEMIALILVPLLILLITTMPIIVRLFYTPAFLPIVMFANWTILGVFLKGVVWPIGFLFVARDNLKLFGFIEVTSMLFSLISNVLGYHFWGLSGLGISFLINYVFGLVLSYFFAYKFYNFYFCKPFVKMFFLGGILISLAFFSALIKGHPFTYFFGGTIFVISLLYSIISIQSRISFLPAIISFLKKNI